MKAGRALPRSRCCSRRVRPRSPPTKGERRVRDAFEKAQVLRKTSKLSARANKRSFARENVSRFRSRRVHQDGPATSTSPSRRSSSPCATRAAPISRRPRRGRRAPVRGSPRRLRDQDRSRRAHAALRTRRTSRRSSSTSSSASRRRTASSTRSFRSGVADVHADARAACADGDVHGPLWPGFVVTGAGLVSAACRSASASTRQRPSIGCARRAPRSARSSDVSAVDTQLVVSDVLLVAGIAAVGVATVLFIVRPGGHEERATVGLAPTPGGFAGALRLSF